MNLFKAFARRWSHKWEKTFIDQKAPDVWLHDLQVLGVTDELMNRGLKKSAGLSWPPSPAEFAALCHPTAEELGLPDVNTAYRHACVSHWSHPVVYAAAKEIGTAELRSMAEAVSRPRFEKLYRKVCDAWMAGDRYEVPKRTAIEHKQDGHISVEKFEAMREDFRKGRSIPAIASLHRVSLCDAWSICEKGIRVMTA